MTAFWAVLAMVGAVIVGLSVSYRLTATQIDREYAARRAEKIRDFNAWLDEFSALRQKT